MRFPGFLALALLVATPQWVRPESGVSADPAEWPSYGREPGGMRYSSLKLIHRGNVTLLRRAWTYHTGEFPKGTESTNHRRITAFECTPLFVNGVLYLSTPSNRVIALDGDTGREKWVFDPQAGRAGEREHMQHRGVAYWERSGAGKPPGAAPDRRILFGTFEARLICLNADTGLPCPDFGTSGAVDLHSGVADGWPGKVYSITSPPAVYKDLVIVGAQVPEGPAKGPSGDIRAFDVRTGALVWTFHSVPRPGEKGHETWEGDSWRERTGVNVWSMISVDPERGMVFLPFGSAAYDFYGGDRKGENLFANSVVALDAATGKLLWYFQAIHHDIWDYDLPAQPVLITVKRDSRDVPAVAQVTKSGYVFVLDRLTGKPLFPVEERPVPRSGIPGEETWPTQPVPVKPPELSRHNLSADDLSTVTPESAKYCRQLFDSMVHKGAFTPWDKSLTLAMPGTLGGATWSGASFDPGSGLLIVNTNELGAVGFMEPQPEGSPFRFRRASPWGEYGRFLDENGWSCVKPPWGTLNAVNVNTGDIVWKVPLGYVDALKAKGVDDTGAPSLGGTIVTAGGLVFIAGTADAQFRAFDSSNGSLLWSAGLEAGGHATPMTYLGRKSGRQFVVIAAGGGGYFSRKVSDEVVAFALPGSPSVP